MSDNIKITKGSWCGAPVMWRDGAWRFHDGAVVTQDYSLVNEFDKTPHTISDNTAIEDAARRTYDIAVRNLRDAVEDYIHSPTLYKIEYINSCSRALLIEEMQRLLVIEKQFLSSALT